MKRIYIFNWEIKSIESTADQPAVRKITLLNGVIYITNKDTMNVNAAYSTFLVQPENIIDDKETVLIPY